MHASADLESTATPRTRLRREVDEEIALRDLVRALWRQKWWIMLVTLLAMAVTAVVSLQMPKIYRATATLVPPEVDQVWPTPDGMKTRFSAASTGSALRPNTTATDVIVGLLKSRRVAEAVIEKFDLKQRYPTEPSLIKLPQLPWDKEGNGALMSDILKKLERRTDVRVTKEGMISISVDDQDPQRAADMVQCYLDELSRMNMELQTTYNQYLSRVVDPPVAPDKKYRPWTSLNMLIAGAAVVFVWMVVVFCRLNLTESDAVAH